MRLLIDNIEQIKASCKKFRVKRLEVFGSFSTGDFNNESDVDLLVEFTNIREPNISDSYFGLLAELENHFKRKVDLVELTSIRNPYFKESIDGSRKLIYGT